MIGHDIAYQMSLVKRETGESDEHLAERLYDVQMEILSANAGHDLVRNERYSPFQLLETETRALWIKKAKTYK